MQDEILRGLVCLVSLLGQGVSVKGLARYLRESGRSVEELKILGVR